MYSDCLKKTLKVTKLHTNKKSCIILLFLQWYYKYLVHKNKVIYTLNRKAKNISFTVSYAAITSAISYHFLCGFFNFTVNTLCATCFYTFCKDMKSFILSGLQTQGLVDHGVWCEEQKRVRELLF